MGRKQQPAKIISQVPVRIPIPERILGIGDQDEREIAIKAHWMRYGYSDRYALDGTEDGHIIMVRK